MKKNWLFTLFIALSFCAIVFPGCKPDADDDDTGGGDTGNSLTAGDFVVTTGGAEWKATNIEATKDQLNRFTISAYKGVEKLVLRANDIVTGTYDLVEENANMVPSAYGYAVYSATGNDNFCTFKTGGEIVITEIDAAAKTISGTFNFNCKYQDESTGAFTDGEFYKLTYLE